MGVDVSISAVGAGVVLDLDGIKAFPEYEDYGVSESLEIYLSEHDAYDKGVSFGVAGNYWTGKPEEQPWIALTRTVETYDLYDLPGGIAGRDSDPTAELTEDERKVLKKFAKKLGTKKPKIERFMSVLWH